MPRYFVDGVSTFGELKTVVVEYADERTAQAAVTSRKLLERVSAVRRAPDGPAQYTIKAKDSQGQDKNIRITAPQLYLAIEKCRAEGFRPLKLKRIELPEPPRLAKQPEVKAPVPQPERHKVNTSQFEPRNVNPNSQPKANSYSDGPARSIRLAEAASMCIETAAQAASEHPLNIDAFESLAPGFTSAHGHGVLAKLLISAGFLHAVNAAVGATKQDAADSVRPISHLMGRITSDLRLHIPQYRKNKDGGVADPYDIWAIWAEDDDYLGNGPAAGGRLVALVIELVAQVGFSSQGVVSDLFKLVYRWITEDIVGADGYISSAEYRAVQSSLQFGMAVDARLLELKEVSDGRSGTLEQTRRELEELIGLDEVKAEVKRFEALLRVAEQRRAAGIPVARQSLHFVFRGNPGTGKTTVARLIGRLLKGYGILRKGHVVEVARSDLVGGFLGQTAIKTAEKIDEAIDGVLFIDEAYALHRPDQPGDTYGEEAIETILKRMEDDRDRLVVIVAGYPAEMSKFLTMNPGLKSRFTRFLTFNDYSPEQLTEIFLGIAEREQYHLSPDGVKALETVVASLYSSRDSAFGNARDIRTLYETALGHQAVRVASMGRPASHDELKTLAPSDIESEA